MRSSRSCYQRQSPHGRLSRPGSCPLRASTFRPSVSRSRRWSSCEPRSQSGAPIQSNTEVDSLENSYTPEWAAAIRRVPWHLPLEKPLASKRRRVDLGAGNRLVRIPSVITPTRWTPAGLRRIHHVDDATEVQRAVTHDRDGLVGTHLVDVAPQARQVGKRDRCSYLRPSRARRSGQQFADLRRGRRQPARS